MFLHQQSIILILSFYVLPCIGLRCTTQCSYTFNRTSSFSIPDSCNKYVTATRCNIHSTYSYEDDEFTIRFIGISSKSNSILENFDQVKLQLSRRMYFTYMIQRECDDRDDCDRYAAETVAKQMKENQKYDLNGIQNELKSLILGPQIASLNCYYSNENDIKICGNLTALGSCVISNNILENQFIYGCGDKDTFSEPFIFIDQTEHRLYFDIQCNQSLCNNQTTLQQTKSIIYKYHITVTPDGHLYNRTPKLIPPITMIIFFILTLFLKTS